MTLPLNIIHYITMVNRSLLCILKWFLLRKLGCVGTTITRSPAPIGQQMKKC